MKFGESELSSNLHLNAYKIRQLEEDIEKLINENSDLRQRLHDLEIKGTRIAATTGIVLAILGAVGGVLFQSLITSSSIANETDERSEMGTDQNDLIILVADISINREGHLY